MLTFKYGVMNCGKTLDLLSNAYDLDKWKKILVTKPKLDTREGKEECIISSRIGVNRKGIWFEDLTSNIINNYDYIFVDEAQFLTESDIDWLREVANEKEVICYGLRTNFKVELFKATKRLLEVADEVVYLKGICQLCGGDNAIYNLRINDEGEYTTEGEEVGIEGEYSYICCCDKCKNKLKKCNK